MATISIRGLSDILGISAQSIEKACKRAAQGRLWRGAQLKIVEVHGRGGDCGKQKRIAIDSLPTDIQEALKAPPKALPAPKEGPALRTAVISQLLDRVRLHPKGTEARGDAIRAVCAYPILNHETGRLECVSPNTIRRWLREEETHGVAALTRKKRADSGEKRAYISTKFDAFARANGIELEPWRDELLGYVRAQHKNHESVSNIAFKAQIKLEKMVRGRGLEPPPAICKIPLWIIKAESHYRQVGVFKRDAKAWADKQPCIRRTRVGMLPGDVVVGDVHPLDFFLPEWEGFQRYAKAICWADVATNRIWMTIVVLPKGEGVRNAHVIASFMEMVAEWGLPKTLYLDNGSEYKWSDFIEDAMKLSSGEDRAVIHAKPYNARAKIIEGIFGLLERHHFAKLPGWIGGDRMRTKTANVGRAPTPFPGSFEFFCAAISGAVALYHNVPQKGALKGRSPFQAWNEAVEAGWMKTHVEPDAFFAAFSTRQLRQIHNGHIRVDGRYWTCDALYSFMRRVFVLIPKFEKWDRLPIEDERGNLLGFAEPDEGFGYLDPAGAKESSRRQKLRIVNARELDSSAPDITPLEETMEATAELPKALVAPIGALVGASNSAKEIAQGVKETPKQKRERENAALERENAEQRALFAEFEAKALARKAKEA
jgi:hypothetical protein